MKAREFFDLAVNMRYVQKHYCKETDRYFKKKWLEACKAYEKLMDDEIRRVKSILRKKAEEYYVLEEIEDTIKKVGEKWFQEHIMESLTFYFADGPIRDIRDYICQNGFYNDRESPTFVINDMGDDDCDDMLEFIIASSTDNKIHLTFFQRLKG